ncbi:uncharacterized protein LOC125185305 [Salvia hispanica]|uniref:uncharacterized protein LOC125185305 n=1 Tax=Salvia hispanica TaxID=49212 RepID=UPI002009B4AE|nr:uncharacterized protein LOC125185305 [Salvia hispanica]
MDVQGHKITATSAGHEGHGGVHHCHRCGWPFPKPHPSSKHRRAHKRVCGTIEGYKIIHSENYLAVSDDDRASEDDEYHTPSPNIVKKNALSSGGESGKSNKSEDDVFSDAAMEFSDSGISPQLEAHFDSVRESGKSSEHNTGMDGDVYGNEELEIKETAETTEQSKDARSEEIRRPGPVSDGNSHPDNVIPITETSAEMVSVGHLNDSQPESGLRGELVRGPDANVQVQELVSASVSLDPEEGTILDQIIVAGGSQEELRDKFVSDGTNNDLLPPSESLQTDAPDEVHSVVHSVERRVFIKMAEVALVDETREIEDASDLNKELSRSTENIGSTKSVYKYSLPEENLLSTSLVEPDERSEALDVTEKSDLTCIVSSNDEEEIPKTCSDASDGEKSYMAGGYENANQSLEPKNLNSVDASSALGFTDGAIPCDDNNITMEKKDVDHCEENANVKTLNEKGKGVSTEVEVIPDFTVPLQIPTLLPSSCVADDDAKSSQVLSENNPSSLEFELKVEGSENSIKGDADSEVNEIGYKSSSVEHPVLLVTSQLQNNAHVAMNVIEAEPLDVAETVTKVEDGNAVLVSGSEENRIGDYTTSTNPSIEHPVPPVASELQNNVHEATNVVEVDPVYIAETVDEIEDVNAVLVSAETPEHSISTESTLPLSDSVLLRDSTAKDGSSVGENYKASESIASTEATAEGHESNVESREILENPTPSGQGAFPTSTCFNDTSLDVKQLLSSDDLCILNYSGDIISSEEQSFVDKVLKSEEYFESSEAPSLNQPVTSLSDDEVLHGTSDTVDDKTVVIVGDVTRINAKSVITEAECKPTKLTEDASAADISSSVASRSDSLEANCGSVVSDTLETNSQKHKIHSNKSDTFEPPSFMTLVQTGSEGDQVTTAAENNQQPKPDALEAGWFPSLTNIVNESKGRKKNEEIIAKVTNWSPVKQQQQQHSPLKSLLNEVKSPNTKQVPVANQKVEAETKDDKVGFVASETHTTKDQDTNKHVEEWSSPARYSVEIKKEKKKGRPFWVPFVCCSSAHGDL